MKAPKEIADMFFDKKEFLEVMHDPRIALASMMTATRSFGEDMTDIVNPVAVGVLMIHVLTAFHTNKISPEDVKEILADAANLYKDIHARTSDPEQAEKDRTAFREAMGEAVSTRVLLNTPVKGRPN